MLQKDKPNNIDIKALKIRIKLFHPKTIIMAAQGIIIYGKVEFYANILMNY